MATIAPFRPVPIMDTFSRATTTTAGAERWGVTDSGAGWRSTKTTNFNISYDVNNDLGEGTIGVTAGSAYNSAWMSLDSAGLGVQETAESLQLMKFSSSTPFPLTDFGPILSREDSQNFYFATIQGNIAEIAIGAYISGTRWELNRRSFTFAKDTWYWVRFQRDSSGLNFKIWKKGVVEPSSWTLTSNLWDASNPPGAGTPGIFYRGMSDTYTVHVDSFYFYTKEADTDAEAGKPVTESFNHSTHRGWGRTDTGQTWEGHFGDDPKVLTKVGYSTGGFGYFSLTNTGSYYGWVGPSTAGAIETEAIWECNAASSGNKVHLYFGLHGSFTGSSGFVQGTGYALRVHTTDNTIQIVKKTSATGGWTQIATATLPFTTAADTRYEIKFQKSGSTLRGNCWVAADAEPSSWQVTATDTDITSGGQLFFSCTQDSDATRLINLNRIQYRGLTTLPGGTEDTTPTTVGAFTLSSIADTSVSYNLDYTDDSNNNNSAVVKYRKSTDSAWTTAAAPTRTTGTTPKKFSGTISGLTSGVTYFIQITITDSDEVSGTNPLTLSFTTTNNQSSIGTLTATAVGTNTASFLLTYINDANVNATASLQKRIFSNNVPIFVHDFYTMSPTADLQGQVGTSSADTFLKHTPSTSANVMIAPYSGRAYMSTFGTDNTNTTAIYYSSATGQAQLRLNTEIYFPTYDMGGLGFVFRLDPVANTYYYTNITGADGVYTFNIYKMVAGVPTLLSSSKQVQIDLETFYELELVMADASGDNLKILYLDGVELCRTSDNSITTPHRFGMRFTSAKATPSVYGDLPFMYGFTAYGQTSSGSWDAVVGMTPWLAGTGPFPEQTHRYFTYNATTLSLDTHYEFRATLADSNGVVGDTTTTTTITTHGNKSYLIEGASIEKKTYPTSAVITVSYFGDSDQDSSLTVQYRLTNEQIWTTVPSAFIITNRLAKTFQTTLSGLRPSSTYEILVTLVDPDGIEEGRDYQDSTTVTTKTIERTIDDPTKKYLWKIYDNVTGKYVTTWHDAGAPKFTFQENSGVSDLSVRLPRPVSSLNADTNSVQQQNIVDVWVVDQFEGGLGPNLLEDEDFSLGGWSFTEIPNVFFYHSTQGVDGGKCIKIVEGSNVQHEALSEAIYVDPLYGVKTNAPATYNNRRDFRDRTFVMTVYAKAQIGRVVLGVYEYGDDGSGGENQLAFSDVVAETVGPLWQKLQISYRVTNKDTQYLRMSVKNDGAGTFWIDKASIRTKEQLLYSGHIESIKRVINDQTEYIDVEVLGESAVLSDDYIEFLQFVEIPQQRDRLYSAESTTTSKVFEVYASGTEAEKTRYGATDPSNMMKYAIDLAQQQNPKCRLYYTEASIRNTGIADAQYTFREKPIRAIFDQIRELAPSGWHYFIMPDGCVHFRGPQHARSHIIRVGVEAIDYEATHTIRNLKNYIYFKGRQDVDFSEVDGYGSIYAIAFDQESIDRYGKRMLYTQDASIVDPKTAEVYAEGRLAELNQPEDRINCTIVDEKAIYDNFLGFRGYNIESFLPGDYVYILNPKADPNYTYWDQAKWDSSLWDYKTAETLLVGSVPIKSITYADTTVELDLSQRPPTVSSEFTTLSRTLQQNSSEK